MNKKEQDLATLASLIRNGLAFILFVVRSRNTTQNIKECYKDADIFAKKFLADMEKMDEGEQE